MGAWRQEQGRDRFFRKAHEEGYRARSAYKLIEIDQRFRLIRRGGAVLDLGAAPGSWSQVAVKLAGPGARIVAVDLTPISPIVGVTTIQGDITDPACVERMRVALCGAADAVLCDAAPSTSGVALVDHAQSLELSRAALAIARQTLRPGGGFVVKVFRGSDFDDFVSEVRAVFGQAKIVVPEAVRKESKEGYVVGLGRAPQL